MALAGCEACGTEINYSGIWPNQEGWVQYGHAVDNKKKYDDDEVAWWCPTCFGIIKSHSFHHWHYIDINHLFAGGDTEERALKLGNIREFGCVLCSGIHGSHVE